MCGRMARRAMGVAAILVRLTILAAVLAVPVLAQTSPPASPSPSQTITCSLPSTLMISGDYCNNNDEQSMDTQTASCEGFLTDSEATPSAACCVGLNNVAYNRTACICKMTFYPPASHNTTRQLDLPGLCNVQTNLCVKCPVFLTTASNGTNPTPVTNAPHSDSNSRASTIGAISLAVVSGLLLVVGIVFGVVFVIKKHKAKKNSAENFEAPPPGGAF